jgi:hypothetical protein
VFENAYSAEPVPYVAAIVGPNLFFAIKCPTDDVLKIIIILIIIIIKF